jgi:filamentous hemagglutinin family protein
MIAKSWLRRCWQWQIGGCVAIFGILLVGGGEIVNAQIVPDNTLGSEGSVVTPNLNLNGIPSDQIDGGAIRGANLFHSFTQFNINAGRGAYFTNPAGIANILSRVTGANRSEILGRLGVNGNANLFLINPKGIVFGPSASLDVQGSFIATTANAVEFGDRGIFSASKPESPQLLNVNPSAFLFNQIPPGSITNRSARLQVPQGQNLILLGGNVNLDGGVLQAPSGRVELAGLAESGRVGINRESNNLSLIFPNGGVRADISLRNRASIEAGGDIQVQGRRVTLTEGSQIKTATEGASDAGKITINTGQLIVRDGAQVTASTTGQGQGGTVVVNAFESIDLSGTSTNGQQSGLFADTQKSAGDAGDIKVDTGQLTLSDGALITSRSRGMGRAGNIVVTVRGTLEANNGTLGTSATESAGGAITVKAGDIRLFGDSNITTSVFDGTGGGGNIDLKADSILAFDRSDILAFADGGKGGDITLDTPAFFGESYRRTPRNTDPRSLDRNNRVDVNATGATDGVITTPDTSSIENSLTELPDDRIDIDSLLATSCIARRDRPTRGSFTITGTGGLPQSPGDAQTSSFPTVDIETLPSDGTPANTNPNRSWQKGDPIVEPQGVYRLPNGQLVLSRECP